LSDAGRREGLEVVGDEVLVAGHIRPLEIIHIELLARAVVHPSEHIYVVVEICGAVEEPGEGHGVELYELQGL